MASIQRLIINICLYKCEYDFEFALKLTKKKIEVNKKKKKVYDVDVVDSRNEKKNRK
jgi:hypothetical protein